MKIAKLLIIIYISFFNLANLLGQASNTFKKARITITNGDIVSVSSLTLNDSTVFCVRPNEKTGFNEFVGYSLNDVTKIQIQSKEKRQIVPGLIIGFMTGVSAMIVLEHVYESPKSESQWVNTGGGQYVSMHREYAEEMSLNQKVAIVSAGTILGAFVGYTIKKGWKTIYPKGTAMINNFDVNLTMGNINNFNSSLNLVYKF